MAVVLGLQFGHDSNCTLLIDGKIAAALVQERIDRIKHSSSPPIGAIEACLRVANLKMRDVDLLAFASVKYAKHNYAVLKEYYPVGHGRYPGYLIPEHMQADTPYVEFHHQKCHAASAYYTQGESDNVLVVTMDGIGDSESMSLWHGNGGCLEKAWSVGHEGTLGTFYALAADILGWLVNDGEGKVMGLAPYGQSSVEIRAVLDKYCPKYLNGELIHPVQPSAECKVTIGDVIHLRYERTHMLSVTLKDFSRENIAATFQEMLEEQVVGLIGFWLNKYLPASLCFAGGVFSNIKLNQLIRSKFPNIKMSFFPSPGDSGLSMGAAFLAQAGLDNSICFADLNGLYLGQDYRNDEIQKIIDIRKLSYIRYHDEKELCQYVASQLAENRIVGWFHGRSEFGPRALGARSILMSVEGKENKEILNARVKFREAFRPFCPSCLLEDADRYFEITDYDPYMITSVNARQEARDRFPAVSHVDGTARLQVVDQRHGRFYALLEAVKRRTGAGVLLNTSMNLKGEPIVENPRDAIKCFYDSGMDLLVLEDFVLEKQPSQVSQAK